MTRLHMTVLLALPMLPPVLFAATAPQAGNAVNLVDEVRVPLRTLLQAAQAAMEAKQWSLALLHIETAARLPTLSAAERFAIRDLRSTVYVRQQRYAEAVPDLLAIVDDPRLPPARQATTRRGLAHIYYALHDYPNALRYAEQRLKAGDTDHELLTIAAQSDYLMGRNRDVANRLETRLRTPGDLTASERRQLALLWLSACVKLQDSGCERRARLALAAAEGRDAASLRTASQRHALLLQRAYMVQPTRRDRPARPDNISDDEVREIESVVAGLYPKTLINIGPVVTGCPCEDGPRCTDQVWVIGYQGAIRPGLLLSRIDGRWSVGPVQQWWRAHQALQEASRSSRTDWVRYQAVEAHVDTFAACEAELQKLER